MMEKNINTKKETNSNDAPPPTKPNYNNKEMPEICYNCTECSSLIEILSINEDNNIIEFKCLNKENKHSKIMTIKEFFEK